LTKKKNPAAVSLGRLGGKRRLETMTPEERTAVAKKAAAKSAEVRTKKAAEKTGRSHRV
jgi:hypothetical protein